MWVPCGTHHRPQSRFHDPIGAGLVLLTSVYLPRCLTATIFSNVPLNNQLASITDPAEAIAFWPHYLRAWTPWNHLLVCDTFCRGALSRLTVNHRRSCRSRCGWDR